MPNPIKYTTGTETLALKKGNFYIGTGDVGKGPSDSTGFYQGISPSEGGYVIYMNREGAPGDLSYHNAPTDNDLITFTNNLAGQSYTTVNECLVYFASQTDKVVLNRNYEGIVTDGLVLNLDAGFTPSYPKNGTTWYDVSVNSYNGTLTNGPTFITTNGGGISGDGTNDFIQISDIPSIQPTDDFSMFATFNMISIAGSASDTNGTIFGRINPSSVVGVFGLGFKYLQSTGQYWIQMGLRTNGNHFIVRDTTYTPNTTAYMGFTYSSGIGRFYVNGALTNTITNTAVTASTLTTDVFQIFGNRPTVGGSGRRPSGYIYTASLYNRQLTSDEVSQNFNALKDRFGL